MSENFFEISSPRGMLEKAKRELKKLEENINTDHIYNFFTTAYHIQDYLKNGNYLTHSVIDKFLNDQILIDCRDLCNKGKHFKLHKNNQPLTIIYDNVLSGNTPLESMTLDGGNEWVFIATNGRTENIIELAKTVISKWEKFFESHKI